MKFGRVANPNLVDFSLPKDHDGNKSALSKGQALSNVFIGLPTWNRQLLKGLYPRGTKDELRHYSNQFNSIEFNASFYNFWDSTQIQSWVDRTSEDFRFFPKVHRIISHEQWLQDFEHPVDRFTESIRAFGSKLGTCFLQLHESFGPRYMDRLRSFVEFWPEDMPLAIELRDRGWFSDAAIADELAELLGSKGISNIILDTPGRRDLIHMRLTSQRVFIRFLGCGDLVDFERLTAWVNRIKAWQAAGMEEVSFFLHHEPEAVTIKLASFLTDKLRGNLGGRFFRPKQPTGQQQLF